MLNTEPEHYPAVVHVAVVVLVKNNRVLIAKRAQEAHQGGLWEFPGGKVEPDESVEGACVREIQEELGINITHSRPLIKILYQYSDINVLLETRLCTQFYGIDYQVDEVDLQLGESQVGLEGQRVKWVKINHLDNYHFPAANKAIVEALLLPEMYLISPDCLESGSQIFLQQFSENCDHYSMIQLRIKSLNGAKLQTLLKECSIIAQ